MSDFFEGIFVMIGFILFIIALNLVFEWHSHNQMDRELQSWQVEGANL